MDFPIRTGYRKKEALEGKAGRVFWHQLKTCVDSFLHTTHGEDERDSPLTLVIREKIQRHTYSCLRGICMHACLHACSQSSSSSPRERRLRHKSSPRLSALTSLVSEGVYRFPRRKNITPWPLPLNLHCSLSLIHYHIVFQGMIYDTR